MHCSRSILLRLFEIMNSFLLLLLKLSMAVLLAAWACIWIVRPTQAWKRSWHAAEKRANAAFIGDYGLTVVVYCLPVLAVAALSYIFLHLLSAEKDLEKGISSSRKKRGSRMGNFSNPAIAMGSPVGIVSTVELLIAALFVIFLSWTYCSNVFSDFNRMTPYKSLQLNRWQLKMMHMAVRIGSSSEACLVILLLPVLRGMAVFRVLGVEFESSVRYHIWIGNGMLLLSFLHGIGIMFVWALKGTLFQEIVKWQSTGRVNIAGALGLANGAAIWITSLPQMRRKQFQLFYSAHHLYILFFLFFLIHAGDRHFYLVLAGVLLFAVDKVLRAVQSRQSTLLVSAAILPCNAVELTLRKHPCMRYTPTSIVFIKVPSVSNFQWHPFTITSTCNTNAHELSLLVKCQGRWTADLRDLLDSAGPADRIPVAVEGPYGPASVAYRRYRSLVLIAGGSGISPFLSILQDIASRNDEIIRAKPAKILLIYAVKKTQDLSMLALISPLLLSRELGDLQMKLFVTQEQGEEEEAAIGQPPVTAEKLLQDLSSQSSKSITFSSRGSGAALPAPSEGLLWRAAITALSFVVFLASLIVLSHVFLHDQEKGSSAIKRKGKETIEKKSPSWIGDLFVVCSLAAAASCCAAAAVFSRWAKKRKSSSMREAEGGSKHENADNSSAGTEVEKIAGSEAGKHEVNLGRRPDLIEMLSEIASGSKEEFEEVGVFVCGPTSMQNSVASFFTRRKKSSMEDCAGKHKCFLDAHFISFSL